MGYFLLICAIAIIILCAMAMYEIQKAKNNLREMSRLCREAQESLKKTSSTLKSE